MIYDDKHDLAFSTPKPVGERYSYTLMNLDGRYISSSQSNFAEYLELSTSRVCLFDGENIGVLRNRYVAGTGTWHYRLLDGNGQPQQEEIEMLENYELLPGVWRLSNEKFAINIYDAPDEDESWRGRNWLIFSPDGTYKETHFEDTLNSLLSWFIADNGDVYCLRRDDTILSVDHWSYGSEEITNTTIDDAFYSTESIWQWDGGSVPYQSQCKFCVVSGTLYRLAKNLSFATNHNWIVSEDHDINLGGRIDGLLSRDGYLWALAQASTSTWKLHKLNLDLTIAAVSETLTIPSGTAVRPLMSYDSGKILVNWINGDTDDPNVICLNDECEVLWSGLPEELRDGRSSVNQITWIENGFVWAMVNWKSEELEDWCEQKDWLVCCSLESGEMLWRHRFTRGDTFQVMSVGDRVANAIWQEKSFGGCDAELLYPDE